MAQYKTESRRYTLIATLLFMFARGLNNSFPLLLGRLLLSFHSHSSVISTNHTNPVKLLT